MPPKKVEEPPPPAPEAEEDARPKGLTFKGLIITEMVARQIGGVEPDPMKTALRDRACDLSKDRKLLEVQSMYRKAGRTLEDAAELAKSSPELRPRSRATLMQDSSLAHEENMRRSVGRLMTDLHLAHDDKLRSSSDVLRCGQVDRMYSWVGKYQPQAPAHQAGKPPDRKAPPYLMYTKDDPVMVGSLRVEPNQRRYAPTEWAKPRQTPAWMVRSTSTPSLRQ
mmetsp:Transcript_69579/g.175737  ORF Transcript_69579/g.175737 Transcript_69579/m.175737 type:complete len:223 (+) Transcript_69579:48-716(+)